MGRLAALVLLLGVPASAQIDDSDLTGGRFSPSQARRLEREGRRAGHALIFNAAYLGGPRTEGGPVVTGLIELSDRSGALHPARLAKAKLVGPHAPDAWTTVDAAGRFSIPAAGLEGRYILRFSLDNRFWAFNNPRSDSSYEWESPVFTVTPGAGQDLGALHPDPATENGKLGVLHLTYLEALDLLEREADTAWWKKPLTVNWPGQADFFSPWGWSLDLTNALAWDVVLHELGHAVQHGALRPEPAGGQHKIDECYSPSLAWSEGWATFFAAAVRLSRDDADAKFEFLVPRRAPIRIENVPEDVCRGQASEWRVASGLWDLIDTHGDGGDRFSLPFSRLWKSLEGHTTGSLAGAWELIAKDLNPGERRAAQESLIWNTVLPARPTLAVSLSRPAF